MFAFAVMCASCGNGGNAVSDASQTDTLGIMSFNIRNSGAKFEDGKNCWDNRREAVAGMIAGTAPVMIGLQEMLPDQVDFLDARLDGYMRIGVGRDDGSRARLHAEGFESGQDGHERIYRPGSRHAR